MASSFPSSYQGKKKHCRAVSFVTFLLGFIYGITVWVLTAEAAIFLGIVFTSQSSAEDAPSTSDLQNLFILNAKFLALGALITLIQTAICVLTPTSYFKNKLEQNAGLVFGVSTLRVLAIMAAIIDIGVTVVAASKSLAQEDSESASDLKKISTYWTALISLMQVAICEWAPTSSFKDKLVVEKDQGLAGGGVLGAKCAICVAWLGSIIVTGFLSMLDVAITIAVAIWLWTSVRMGCQQAREERMSEEADTAGGTP